MKKLIPALLVLFAFPALGQEALSPLQQYLYNESGYAPPVQQPAVPVYPQQQQVYAGPQPVYVPQEVAPDAYYEDEGADDDSGGDSAGLRAMMTSSGF